MADKKSSFPTQPRLVGTKIYLKPATAEDVANTYHWFLLSDPVLQSRRPQPFLTPTEAAESYRKKEKTPNEQLFLIVQQKGSTPVGVIRFFNWNALNRSAELGLLIDPDERRHGYALEALQVLCRYLFFSRDLNKVHAQTASFNTAACKLVEKAGFKRDAVLRHEYFNDSEFHDGYIYSMLRFEFER
jgi:RimJ/RimL family protein N-acetyltransferase